jgi:hypothetical protein
MGYLARPNYFPDGLYSATKIVSCLGYGEESFLFLGSGWGARCHTILIAGKRIIFPGAVENRKINL